MLGITNKERDLYYVPSSYVNASEEREDAAIRMPITKLGIKSHTAQYLGPAYSVILMCLNGNQICITNFSQEPDTHIYATTYCGQAESTGFENRREWHTLSDARLKLGGKWATQPQQLYIEELMYYMHKHGYKY